MTFVHKDIRGNWSAVSTFSEELKDVGMVLKISTHKVYGGLLITSAQVGKVEGGFFTYTAYQDFYKRLSSSSPARLTQRVVEQQHNDATAQVPSLFTDIANYYAAKTAEFA